MTFIDNPPPTKAGDDCVTVEVGHVGWRAGHVVETRGHFTVHQVRAALCAAFEYAGAMQFSPHDLVEPGWWTVHVGRAMMELGPTRVQRTRASGYRHVTMMVADRTMVTAHPDWPMVRLAPTQPWLDLRGEAALRHGPSDTELEMYREERSLPDVATFSELRAQFQLGVLEWMPGEPKGRRRGVRAAGS